MPVAVDLTVLYHAAAALPERREQHAARGGELFRLRDHDRIREPASVGGKLTGVHVHEHPYRHASGQERAVGPLKPVVPPV